MNKLILKISGLALLFVLVIPTGAEAYRFVDSSAVQVSPDTYLLTHTYTAGFLNEDAHVPIVAAQDHLTAADYPRVEFAITGVADTVLQAAKVNALVLSNATIDDNRYLTTEGTRETFTLFALVTLPQALSGDNAIALSMESLPFSYTRDGEVITGVYDVSAGTADQTVAVEVSDILINVGK